MRRYCKNCKKISEADQELYYCSHCGAPFEPVGESSQQKPEGELPPVTPMAHAQAQAGGEHPREEKYCAWEDKARLGFFGALYETWKESLFNPSRFFRRMPVTGGVGNPLLYGIILGMVGVIFSLMYEQFWGSLFNMAEWYDQFGAGMDPDFYEYYELSYQLQSISMLVWLLIAPVFIALGLFIGTGISHLILMIFGWSKTTFEGTFRVFSYSESAFFFEIIPLFGGLISMVWAVVLYVIGLKEVHRLSIGQSLLVVFLPLILFCLCCCGFLTMIFSMAGLSNM